MLNVTPPVLFIGALCKHDISADGPFRGRNKRETLF